MINRIQNEAELKELKHKISCGSTQDTEKDPDTALSMIVLLLTCVALAALAHVIV